MRMRTAPSTFSNGEQLGLSFLARPAAPPPVEVPRSWWPTLEGVDKVTKRRVVTMDARELGSRIDALAPRNLPVAWPHPSSADVSGQPYPWPQVIDVDILRHFVERGALIVVNDSGGKDSQVMGILLARVVPAAQLLFAHAILPEVEWEGTEDHARQHAAFARAPFVTAQAGKTFLQMAEDKFRRVPDKPSWPTPGERQCTSDLKRGPLERVIRGYAEHHGFDLIVNAMGLRSLESPGRSRQPAWGLNRSKTLPDPKKGWHPPYPTKQKQRVWVNYLPVHHLTRASVFRTIAAAGQRPHPAYAAGNDRLSCVFCIMGKKKDLRNGVLHYPELFERVDEMETRMGYGLHASKIPLREMTGLTPDEAKRQRRTLPVLQGAFLPDDLDAPENGYEAECGGDGDVWVDEGESGALRPPPAARGGRRKVPTHANPGSTSFPLACARHAPLLARGRR